MHKEIIANNQMPGKRLSLWGTGSTAVSAE